MTNDFSRRPIPQVGRKEVKGLAKHSVGCAMARSFLRAKSVDTSPS